MLLKAIPTARAEECEVTNTPHHISQPSGRRLLSQTLRYRARKFSFPKQLRLVFANVPRAWATGKA